MAFDISTSHYEPCPECGATIGLGIIDTTDGVCVDCRCCHHQGPKIANDAVASWEERDRLAFAGWNHASRQTRGIAYGGATRSAVRNKMREVRRARGVGN